MKAASEVVWRDEDIKIQEKDKKSMLSEELSNIEPNEPQIYQYSENNDIN